MGVLFGGKGWVLWGQEFGPDREALWSGALSCGRIKGFCCKGSKRNRRVWVCLSCLGVA